MKFVIASDSFKGCLTSSEVGDAVSEGIRMVYPSAEIISLNVGDGGEGTADALIEALGAQKTDCITLDPLGREIRASYGIVKSGNQLTAIMDLASSCGLKLISPSERKIMEANTYGAGLMILDAIKMGCKELIVGIGGSATCDGGIGMLAALGIKFYDSDNNLLPPLPSVMNDICRIDDFEFIQHINNVKFSVICDVKNPLCGENGAARIFAPQKGASEYEVDLLEKGLCNLGAIFSEVSGLKITAITGGGAAGGVGAALQAMCHADIAFGVDKILDIIKFDNIIEGAELVITGEGSIDRQTLFGKLPYGVYRRAAKKKIRVVAIAGKVSDSEALLNAGFEALLSVSQHERSLEHAMRPDVAYANIKNTIIDYIKA